MGWCFFFQNYKTGSLGCDDAEAFSRQPGQDCLDGDTWDCVTTMLVISLNVNAEIVSKKNRFNEVIDIREYLVNGDHKQRSIES